MSSTTLLSGQAVKPDMEAKGQDEAKSAHQNWNGSIRFMSDRTLRVMVTLLVFFYAPQAFTYFLDRLETPTLTDKIMSLLVSDEFAYGKGSGYDGQFDVLLRNYAAMLPHSVAGSVAIVVGLAQFSKTLQFRYPAIHRNLGRVYYLCAMFISLTSASFLYHTIPTNEVFSGETFSLILSLLSLATFLTMNLAVCAVWSRDISSHREFMALNYSLMLSAPILRVCWLTIAQFWDEPKDVINLFSGVLAGPFLVAAPMFYPRRRQSRPANSVLVSSKVRLAAVVSGLSGILFLIPRLPSFDAWSYQTATLLSVGPQWIFQAVTFTVLKRIAKDREDKGAFTAWTTYQNGLIWGPAWGVPAYLVCHNLWGFSEENIGLSTVFGGWVTGLFMAYIIHVFATSTFASPYNHAVKAR